MIAEIKTAFPKIVRAVLKLINIFFPLAIS